MRELIVHPTIKTKKGRKIKVKALIDSRCTNTTIARKIVEKKGIPTRLLPKPFDIVMLNSCSGNKSDIFHHNNKNN